MQISRHFTSPNVSAFDMFQWERRRAVIAEPDGTVVFEMDGVEVPSGWGQIAVDILASKYLRKAGVPQREEDHQYVARDFAAGSLSVKPDSAKSLSYINGKAYVGGEALLGPERSLKQTAHRLALCWMNVGERHEYFENGDDSSAFYDEVVYMLLSQMAAPNSPQWFNAGLFDAYGITGPSQGHYVADFTSGDVALADSAYEHPQVHACFISNVEDTLLRPGGIYDYITREARLFKYGSGSGANVSNLRAANEPLSSGGRSSGLMSWLKIADQSAGAIKSGGTTRRAAKMVVLNADHPNIVEFIRLKAREELKVAAMVEGLPRLTPAELVYAAKTGLRLDYDFNGEAYQTVTGQNANNSVRVTDDFMLRATGQRPSDWNLTRRTDGKAVKTVSAADVLDEIAEAAWRCADPGMQFDTTYNDWHTCPAAGRINATNPCSEYAFLDNTACNLASLNVIKFFNTDTRAFDVQGFKHAAAVWTVVLEISVAMAGYPAEQIAELSWKYRTLGLGYANLGALLMRMGLAYDSDQGRAVGAAITAVLTGQAYYQSAVMAESMGAFPGYAAERPAMLGVIQNHATAAGVNSIYFPEYARSVSTPVPCVSHDVLNALPATVCSNAAHLSLAAIVTWREALRHGVVHGYRNAQTTCIAPTGTIGLLMECDTTGVEPDFAIIKYKKLSGGGMMRVINDSVSSGLFACGLNQTQVNHVLAYVLGTPNLSVMFEGVTLESRLRGHGISYERIQQIAAALPLAFHVKHAIPELESMGLGDREIESIDGLVCGYKTVEGAPHLASEHYAVFDCASPGGTRGTRLISWMGHLRMLAAAQAFISGSISKTINMPASASQQDVRNAYVMGWELGIKAVALYRDGSKRSQPLNTKVDDTANSGVAQIAVLRDDLATLHLAILGRTASEERSSSQLTEDALAVYGSLLQSQRRRRLLPADADAVRHKFQIGNVKGYILVTLYEDGSPGELFIQCSKSGSTLAGLVNAWTIAVSHMFQYGVPVETIVRKFAFLSFAPDGMTSNNELPFAKSLVDYVARWLGRRFVSGYAPQSPALATPSGSSLADVPASQVRSAPSGRHPRPVMSVTDNFTPAGVAVQSVNAMVGADAPPCDVCGMLMVSAGGCFKCNHCGAGGSCG